MALDESYSSTTERVGAEIVEIGRAIQEEDGVLLSMDHENKTEDVSGGRAVRLEGEKYDIRGALMSFPVEFEMTIDKEQPGEIRR